MGFYIETVAGNYYTGDKKHYIESIEVPERPSSNHTWNGSSWELDLSLSKTAALDEVKARAKELIDDLDLSVDKADIRTALISHRTDFQNATDQAEIDIVKAAAIASIEAL